MQEWTIDVIVYGKNSQMDFPAMSKTRQSISEFWSFIQQWSSDTGLPCCKKLRWFDSKYNGKNYQDTVGDYPCFSKIGWGGPPRPMIHRYLKKPCLV